MGKELDYQESLEIELSTSGVDRFVETFDYSGQEWAEIELSAQPAREGPLTEEERWCLRRAGTVYRLFRSADKGFLKQQELMFVTDRENIHLLANELHEALIEAHATNGKYRQLLKLLAKLRDDMSILSTNPLPPRENYYREIFGVWVDKLGGGLGVSRHSQNHKLGGPLVRFFQAVTRPVLAPEALAIESISKIVGRERKRRANECRKKRRKRGGQAPAVIAGSVEEAPPWPDTSDYTDLGPFLTNPKISFDRQVHDYVVKRGRTTGLKHMVAFNADGTVLAHASGKRNRILLPGKLVAALNDPANKIVIHLNNPSNIGLSAVDIATLGMPGVEAIWRHGNWGNVARGALTPKGRAMLRRNTPKEAWGRLFRIANGIEFRLYDVLQDAVRAGKILVDQAKTIDPHLVCLTLRRAGILDYRSERTSGRRTPTSSIPRPRRTTFRIRRQ
jgi:hypothetical protein